VHNGFLPHAFKLICLCVCVYIYTYVKSKKLLTSLFKARRENTISSETVQPVIWQTFLDVSQWSTALYASNTLLPNIGKMKLHSNCSTVSWLRHEAVRSTRCFQTSVKWSYTATDLPSVDSGTKRSDGDEHRPKRSGTWSDDSRDDERRVSALRVFMLLLDHSKQMVR
jgi:hypothetical protein